MKIIEHFPNWLSGGGIFGALLTNYPTAFEWLTESTVLPLDSEYFGNKSGLKQTSTFVDELAKQNDDKLLSSSDIVAICNVIYTMYKGKWGRLYAVAKSEYNPIENYSMVEEETPDITRTRGESRNTKIITSGGTSANNNMYGFNSVNPVPQSTGTTSASETVEGDKDDNTVDVTETETGTRTLTRSGNIGVTTSQQMIESEIKLWQWNFFNAVFADIDDILTAKYYERGC